MILWSQRRVRLATDIAPIRRRMIHSQNGVCFVLYNDVDMLMFMVMFMLIHDENINDEIENVKLNKDRESFLFWWMMNSHPAAVLCCSYGYCGLWGRCQFQPGCCLVVSVWRTVKGLECVSCDGIRSRKSKRVKMVMNLFAVGSRKPSFHHCITYSLSNSGWSRITR